MTVTKTSPKKGDKFTLASPGGHGIGIGAIPSGTKVSIDLVHTEPVPGVGGVEGVLFSWDPEDSTTARAAHLPLDDFLRLFEKVGK